MRELKLRGIKRKRIEKTGFCRKMNGEFQEFKQFFLLKNKDFFSFYNRRNFVFLKIFGIFLVFYAKVEKKRQGIRSR